MTPVAPRQVRYASPHCRSAFTLVEILIVVMILGILATMVIPHVTSANEHAKDAALRDDIRLLRTQVSVYKAQHRDAAPGYPAGNTAVAPTSTAFAEQITMFTSEQGETSATATPTHRLGPYIQKVPANAVNQKDTWLLVGNGQPVPAATGAYGWIYKPETEEIYPDIVGNDKSGVPYRNY
jgi:prepilin-type N-terminal cleavage/methylation domain-containing protein